MKYSHIVAITTDTSNLQLKEYLDIALVCASYDCGCVIFISTKTMKNQKKICNNTLTQSLNMLAEFGVPFFSDHKQIIQGHEFKDKTLVSLKNMSKHHFIF